ncbi:uncharacterized protein DUF3592 [Chitinophaga dinghuensis]|uniref:Uncharacterized protein DUF3592 n=1 Tax=Chitinophaga dinghuensis TaxID=1539050 RepID=A0A327VTK5_9BACT|nr:DUF3592 domain-containing protein [Chitinophaga dinghuensis]RAJ77359.1 uncharacterized protein DUF3592 [Chitinophaga dinghuensis]
MRYTIYLLTGLTLLAISIYNWKQAFAFIARSERAIGVVTSLHKDDDSYWPVFSIRTKEGDEIIYQHPYGSSPASWRVGEEATFLYDPQAPESPRMVGYFTLFNWAIVFMGLAIPLIVSAIGYFILAPLTRIPAENNTWKANRKF